MQPSDQDFDRLANRLSEDLSNDEKQLNELGATVFTMAKLLELKGRYLERLEQFDFWQGILMKTAMWSPLLLVLGTGLLWLKVIRAGWMLLVAFPVTLTACFAGVFLMYRQFGIRKKIENWLEEVEEELASRQVGK